MPEEKSRKPKPPRQSSRSTAPKGARTGWDAVASWYDGWMGKGGSIHHQKLGIPAVMKLLELQPGEQVLDIGAGQGVLAQYVAEQKGIYTGVDVSPKLLDLARKHHGKHWTAAAAIGDDVLLTDVTQDGFLALTLNPLCISPLLPE